MTAHVMTVTCPDRPGIVASVARGVFELGANIIENAQFSDETTTFCMRIRSEAAIDDAAEVRLLELVRDHDIDLVVLARYMQILSDAVCENLAGRLF